MGMTLEERNNAKKVIRNFDLNNPKVNSLLFSTEEITNAFDTAIKALEQEPCEDCISRQAVMDCFKKWQPYMATRLWDFEQELSALQSVTSQPKIGRWNHNKCDMCGARRPPLFDNYCPNCGAKMEVEE